MSAVCRKIAIDINARLLFERVWNGRSAEEPGGAASRRSPALRTKKSVRQAGCLKAGPSRLVRERRVAKVRLGGTEIIRAIAFSL
jgi:hypothetical protein